MFMLFWRPPPGESNRFFVVDLFRGEEWGCCSVVLQCGGCVEVDESVSSGGGRQASLSQGQERQGKEIPALRTEQNNFKIRRCSKTFRAEFSLFKQ